MTPDGVLLDYRWVVARDGKLQLSLGSCFGCHSRLMPDGSVLLGAPSNYNLANAPAVGVMLDKIAPTLPELRLGEKLYASFGVPWVEGRRARALQEHARGRARRSPRAGHRRAAGHDVRALQRQPVLKTRMADLRGVRDRRYLDATGTHRTPAAGGHRALRHPGRVRAGSGFGPHHFLPRARSRKPCAPPDAAMYALGLYVYSLDPAPSPYPFDELARKGQAIFTRRAARSATRRRSTRTTSRGGPGIRAACR
jgi:hypothetical protein